MTPHNLPFSVRTLAGCRSREARRGTGTGKGKREARTGSQRFSSSNSPSAVSVAQPRADAQMSSAVENLVSTGGTARNDAMSVCPSPARQAR